MNKISLTDFDGWNKQYSAMHLFGGIPFFYMQEALMDINLESKIQFYFKAIGNYDQRNAVIQSDPFDLIGLSD